MIAAVDELAKFQQWKKEVLPALQKDVASGVPAKDMMAKYEAALTARLISLAMLEEKASSAIVAIKDLLDRVQGKAVETKEITHRLGKLSQEELDAMLKTKLKDLTDVTVESIPALPKVK